MLVAREGHAVQPVEPSRGEEAQRIPSRAPNVADALGGVDDEEGDVAAGEVVADREACLPAADDEGVDALDVE
jgi:hypothetical protein